MNRPAVAPHGQRGGADDWIERVRAASDIAEVIGQTVALRRAGRNFSGLCPFHKEKTPSFSVNVERQFYHCFGCKASGDVFKFIQETENVPFLEAAELLSRRAGIPVPERGRPGERGARVKLVEAMEAAATAYEQWLADPAIGATVRAYLERRGITEETRRRFRLGLSLDAWDALAGRLRARFDEDTLVTAGLASRKTSGQGIVDRFRNRLMVPLTAGGQVIGFCARQLSEADHPKYLNSPETPLYHKGSFLFALDLARREVDAEGELVVVEGQFDAMALHQAGLRNTVATSGTALTSEQAALLRRVVGRVALTYDGDTAGQEAMMRSLGVLLAEGLDVAIVELAKGDDPDTLIKREGVAGWEAARARAHDPIDFLYEHLIRRAEGRDPNGEQSRLKALQAVAQLVTRVADPIRRELFLERADQTLGLKREVVLRAAGSRAPKPNAGPPEGVAAPPVKVAPRDAAEEHLLRALLHAPEAVAPASEQVHPEDFRDPACASLARSLWASGGAFPEDGPEASLARELASDERELDWMEEARGAVRVMVQRRLREERTAKLQELRSAPQGETSARLMEDIERIARSLRDWGVST